MFTFEASRLISAISQQFPTSKQFYDSYGLNILPVNTSVWINIKTKGCPQFIRITFSPIGHYVDGPTERVYHYLHPDYSKNSAMWAIMTKCGSIFAQGTTYPNMWSTEAIASDLPRWLQSYSLLDTSSSWL